MIGFDLDSYPVFYDITEIFMAMGIIYTSDSLEIKGQIRPICANKDTVSLMEKYFDYF